MSRLKKNRNIGNLIEKIQIIKKNQCSFSEQDLNVLNDILSTLENLKRKKGRTNEQVLTELVKVFELLAKFFS